MSRATKGLQYSATPGATQGTDLQAWLAANLAEWTVGPLITIGAGVSEKNFMILTHASGGEIMIYCPNGSSMRTYDAIHADYTAATGWTGHARPVAFSYAPEGGFTVAFGSYNPYNLDFWENIAVTQNLIVPTPVITMEFWYNGLGARSIYFIEDSSREALTVYAGTGSYSCFVAGRDLIVPRPEPVEFQVQPYGAYYLDPTATPSSPTPVNSFLYGWDENELRYDVTADFSEQSVMKSDTDANQPYSDDSKYQAYSVAVVGTRVFGTLHSEYFRTFPRTTSTWKSKRGASSDFKFVHLFQDLLTPWDNTLAAPA